MILPSGVGRTIDLWIQNEPLPRTARVRGFALGKAGSLVRALPVLPAGARRTMGLWIQNGRARAWRVGTACFWQGGDGNAKVRGLREPLPHRKRGPRAGMEKRPYKVREIMQAWEEARTP